MPKYIFVTGGVLSSLGKGIAASSLGTLLEHKKFKIALLKFDPYINVDPGTMNPYQHGEVYVTDDGAETDLDLGHYFRFTNSPLNKKSSVSTGQIYSEVIRRERKGDYLGKTVQVIPHITDEIKQRILACAHQQEGIDIVIVEIGGTVGDIESLPYLESIRQFRNEHPNDCVNIHLTYVPFVKSCGEVKTKPTQHSVQQLRTIGIAPDFILCRCEQLLAQEERDKISLFCNVPREAVFDAVDVDTTIYEIPMNFHNQGMEIAVLKKLGLPDSPSDLKPWKVLVDAICHPKESVRIGIVGKYVVHQDAYKSVFEALTHAGAHLGVHVELVKIEPDKFSDEKSFPDSCKGCDGYLIPGGFGDRGWEGKILAAQYCRENKVPYFGICLGMQVMVVEFARNVLKYAKANSTEMDAESPYPVISLLEEQNLITDRGGTMRLGNYPCTLKKATKAYAAYNADQVLERHRHRYEFNNSYKEAFQKAGLVTSGLYETDNLMEICEIASHPWMVGVQFHPEFRSKPLVAHPLFCEFVQHSLHNKKAHATKKP